jgi:hypothetical protein
MRGNVRPAAVLAALIAAAALAVTGCGGDDETTTTTSSTTTTTGATGATGASGPEGADGGGASLEDARSALEDEGYKIMDVDTSNTFVDPAPEAVISIEGPNGVAQGTVYEYSDAADAKKAAANSEKEDTDDTLDNVAEGTLFFQASVDPVEGPTVDEMIEIVNGE